MCTAFAFCNENKKNGLLCRKLALGTQTQCCADRGADHTAACVEVRWLGSSTYFLIFCKVVGWYVLNNGDKGGSKWYDTDYQLSTC